LGHQDGSNATNRKHILLRQWGVVHPLFLSFEFLPAAGALRILPQPA